MGVYTRDYFRQGYSGSDFPPTCKNLIILTVGVFLLQIFITRPTTPEDIQRRIERIRPPKQERLPSMHKKTQPTSTAAPADDKKKPHAERSKSDDAKDTTPAEDESDPSDNDTAYEDYYPPGFRPTTSIVQEWFELDTDKVVYQGQIWRLLTSAFCHDRFGVWHIVFNMLFLYWFGRMLEPLYGSREFLLFYLTAAVCASVCYVGLDLFTHRSVPAIGASGAVMAVVVLYAIHHPRDVIYVYFTFPIEVRWLVLIYLIYDLHPVLLALAGTPQYTGVANAAHLGGAAFGWVYARRRLRLNDIRQRLMELSRRWRFRWQLRQANKARLQRPNDERNVDTLQAQVDRILQKIHDKGESSLSDVERDVLKIAASKLKNPPEE